MRLQFVFAFNLLLKLNFLLFVLASCTRTEEPAK